MSAQAHNNWFSFDAVAQRVGIQLPQARCLPPPSKKHRSRARSGRLHGRVRRAGASFRPATRICQPHRHAITPARRAPIGTTPRTRSHNARRTFSTTSVRTTSAQRAWARRALAQRAPKAETTSYNQKRVADHAPQRPNVLPISRCERTAKSVKMPMISRAKRSAAGACSAHTRLLYFSAT